MVNLYRDNNMRTHARYGDTRNNDSRLGGFRTFRPLHNRRTGSDGTFSFFGVATASKLQRICRTDPPPLSSIGGNRDTSSRLTAVVNTEIMFVPIRPHRK